MNTMQLKVGNILTNKSRTILDQLGYYTINFTRNIMRPGLG
jgi:hypothetical protein